LRLGRGRLKDLLRELDDVALDAAAEAIAEDLAKVDIKAFIRHLLECTPISCIAEAIVKAGGGERDPES